MPVPSETDGYSTVTALPDGAFRRVISNVPERVRRDNRWVDVDATLVANGDGTYSPAAAAAPLTVSGGGTGPLAVLTSHGQQLAITWPDPLPAPTVDGDTAIYADVLPDVDLRVTADTMGGLSDVLVVKTAAAAHNPALVHLRIGTTVSQGLHLAVDPGGNIRVADTNGNTVFHAPSPSMWDSGVGNASGPLQPDVAAGNPARTPPPGAAVAAIAVSAAQNSLTLTPDHALLTGAGTHYPVYIDPSWTGSGPDFAWVQQAYPSASNWNSTSSGEPAVGYQGWDSPYGITRSFFQFSPGVRTSYHILSAWFKATAVYSGSWDCNTGATIDLHSVAPISSSIDWNNQPATWQLQSTAFVKHAYGSCPDVTAAFDVTTSIVNDNGQGTVTYRMTAANESDKNAYMRFSHKATLTIDYNQIPDVPTNFAFSPAPLNPSTDNCGSTNGWIGATSAVTLAAHISDPDGSAQNVQGQFQFWDKGASGTDTAINILTYADPAGHSGWISGSGGTVSVQVAASELTNGHRYGSNVRTYDGTDSSASSGCYFWYDDTAPVSLSITSTDYPSSGDTPKYVGQPGVFHLSADEVIPAGGTYSNINHFTYSTSSAADLAGDGGTHVTPTLSGATGTYDLTLTPSAWGVSYLYFAAVDNAGNESATYTYTFYVPDNPAAAVSPGDIDSDGRPDLVAANKVSKNLELYPTLARAPSPAVIASRSIDSPDGSTWADTLVAHRASPTGGKVDDLWAHKKGGTQLYLYRNNINQPGGLGGDPYYTATNSDAVVRPGTCADPDCGAYSPDNWSRVTQLLAPGDMDGDGVPDLLTVEDGTLWFYPGTGAASLGTPHNLGTGWGSFRLVAPGDASGDGIPDLWGFDDTGAFNLYYTTRTAGDPTSVRLTEVDGSDPYLTSDQRPLITSPGDADGDGIPDLYTTVNVDSGQRQLWANMGTRKSTDPPTLQGQNIVDDTIDWSDMTDLA